MLFHSCLPGQAARHRSAPANAGQARLWLMYKNMPDRPLSQVCTTTHIQGLLDLAALSEAFSAVTKRHEALRSRFEIKGAALHQTVESAVAVPLVIDTNGVAEGELRRELRAFMARPFQLEGAPLWRARLIQLGQESHILTLQVHHAVIDGDGIRTLLCDLGWHYRTALSGSPAEPVLPPVGSWIDCLQWRADFVTSLEYECQLAYWSSRVSALSMPARLPRSAPPDAARLGTGAMISGGVLAPHVTTRLQALASSERSTFFMVVLAGFAMALARVTGSAVVSVAVPFLGNRQPEWESSIGLHTVVLPMVFHVTPHSSFSAVLAEAREQTIEAMANMDVSYADLMTGDEVFHPEMFHAQLTYTDGARPETDLELAHTVCSPVDLEHEAPQFFPTLGANLVDDQLTIWLSFDAATYCSSDASNLLAVFEAELSAAAEDASVPAQLPFGDANIA